MSDAAQFDWLFNVAETAFAEKESKTALNSRASMVESTMDTVDSRLTALEVSMRTLEGHGAFSEFRVSLQQQYDGKETKTSLSARDLALDPDIEEVESTMSKLETALRIVEQDFLDFLTDEAL